jgi:hypothetical protein
MEDESLPARSVGTASGGFAVSCGRSSICLAPPGVRPERDEGYTNLYRMSTTCRTLVLKSRWT